MESSEKSYSDNISCNHNVNKIIFSDLQKSCKFSTRFQPFTAQKLYPVKKSITNIGSFFVIWYLCWWTWFICGSGVVLKIMFACLELLLVFVMTVFSFLLLYAVVPCRAYYCLRLFLCWLKDRLHTLMLHLVVQSGITVQSGLPLKNFSCISRLHDTYASFYMML